MKIKMSIIKNILKKTPLYPYLFYLKIYLDYLKFLIFDRKNPLSPSAGAFKIVFIRKIAKKTKIPIFIETGTYLGSTVNGVKDLFEEIYSIELDTKLATRAKELFREIKKINILEGDSANVLPQLLKGINRPVLFWLDAHYSGGITAKGEVECPILDELKAIFNWWIPGSIILIDDARLFKREIWPEISEIYDLCLEYDKTFLLKNDIIIIN